MVNYSINFLIIFTLVIVSIIPIILFGFYSIEDEKKLIEHQQLINLQQILDSQKEKTTYFFNEKLSDIKFAQNIPYFQNNKNILFENTTEKNLQVKENIRTIFKNALDIYNYESIWVIDTDLNRKMVVGKDVGNIKYVSLDELKHMKNGLFLSDVYRDFDNDLELFVSIPIVENNVQLGYLIYDIDIQRFFKATLFELELSDTGETVVIQRHGDDVFFIKDLRFSEFAPLSQPISSDTTLAIPALESASGIFGVGYSVDYRGEDILAAWDYIPLTRWGIVAKIDTSEAFADLKLQQNNIILFGIILIGISLSIGIFLSRIVIVPLQKLTKITKEISADGLHVHLNPSGSTELKTIIQSFNVMSESIKKDKSKITHQLKDSNVAEKKFRDLFENSPNPIVLVDPKTFIFLDCNVALNQSLQYSREEFIGASIDLGIHKKSLDVINHIKNSMSNYLHTEHEEFQISRKDGVFLNYIVSGFPIFDIKLNKDVYVFFVSDVTELYDARKKILEQLKHLKTIDIQKDEFATMTSHELKTPIVPIQGYCEMLLEEGLIGKLNQEQHESVEKILFNIKHLRFLIERILTAQRLDLGRQNWKLEIITLDKLMIDIHQGHLSMMKEKNIHFSNVSADNLEFTSDVNQLYEVFTNIIQNAVDFTPTNGEITINSKIRDNDILFSIHNTGDHIPKDQQEHLFKKFYQTDTSLTRKHGGTGLGLSICKGIVDGLGGKIWVNSEKGRGVEFCFTVPKK